jgi:hypothetical protein
MSDYINYTIVMTVIYFRYHSHVLDHEDACGAEVWRMISGVL